jgi:hypothetical protein
VGVVGAMVVVVGELRHYFLMVLKVVAPPSQLSMHAGGIITLVKETRVRPACARIMVP